MKILENKIKFLLNLLLILIPAAFILGNAVLNITVLLFDILFLVVFFSTNAKKLKLGTNKLVIIFTLIFLTINLLFSINYLETLYANLGIARYLIFVYSITWLSKNKIINIEIFFKSTFFIYIFVFFDSLLQYIFGKDIFGYETIGSHPVRLSGPFGDEAVAGAYLAKMIFIYLFSLVFIFKKKNVVKYISILGIIILILLTQERSALIMAITSCALYVFFDNTIKSKYKTLGFIFLFVLVASLISSKKFSSHYFDRTLEQIGFSKNPAFFKHSNFLDSQWGAHFLTSVEIFKNYPLTGSGLKTFQFECSKSDYEKINSVSKDKRCGTHPHNIFLEVLSDAGIILFVIYLFFLINILKKILSIDISKKYFLLANFFILFWPIQTTGSIFQTWNGFFFVYFFILLFNYKKIGSN